MAKGQKYYAVAKGRVPGIYMSWPECEAQVKGFGGAIFKSFKTNTEAESFVTASASRSGIESSNTVSRQSNSAAAAAMGANTTVSCIPAATSSEFPNEAIYIDPQCHQISSYNISHPNEVKIDKSKRSEGHIGAGLVSRLYAVANGRQIGVYSNWKYCEKQIKGVTRAMFKAFYTLEESIMFIQSNVKSTNNKRPAESTEGDVSNKRAQRNSSSTNCDLDIIIYFDGGSRGNPGVAGAGVQVKCTTKEKTITYLIRQYCGDKQTNNYAEYNGLITGLKQAKSFVSQHMNDVKKDNNQSSLSHRIRVYGDSNLVVQQVNGCWQCKNDNLKPLYSEARMLFASLNCNISLEHVYRDQNKVADELANEAMDQRRSWTTSSVETMDNTAATYHRAANGEKPASESERDVIDLAESDDRSVISC